MKKSWFETEGPIELTEEEAVAFLRPLKELKKGSLFQEVSLFIRN